MSKNKKQMWLWIVLAVIGIICASVFIFINQPSFGSLPQGARLERIKRSPHYRDGQFNNLHPTQMMTSDEGRFGAMLSFLFRKTENLRPENEVPVIKTDLHKLGRDENVLIWFGHSSYFIQVDGKRFLVDPVFWMASPVSFVNKPFKGTDVYKPEDMPDIDYLVISHDHWDHLDYRTVKSLKDRVGKVICGLGVGEHFEYWGYDKDRLVELDWYEDAVLENGFAVHCLPTRHFSGRGLKANQTLWASFLIKTPSQKIYMAGDGGYDSHFEEIGKRFPDIDLAILENGQYNEGWSLIHLMPSDMAKAAKDLKAKKIMTVHHSKYALAKHPWNEPLTNEKKMQEQDSLNMMIPEIGEVMPL